VNYKTLALWPSSARFLSFCLAELNFKYLIDTPLVTACANVARS
jgi:hypothetical protein